VEADEAAADEEQEGEDLEEGAILGGESLSAALKRTEVAA
jgi:hypothetical protein